MNPTVRLNYPETDPVQLDSALFPHLLSPCDGADQLSAK
jgi:hypothetical protein